MKLPVLQICKLGVAAYCQKNKNPENYLIGIYHANSWQSNKDKRIASFKGEGLKRVVIATTALCMGINFPDVHYIINWGPPRTIIDQHQEAGQAGRDGLPAYVIVILWSTSWTLQIRSKRISEVRWVHLRLRAYMFREQLCTNVAF